MPGRVVPLPALDAPCEDLRLPALAGPWAVGCDERGRAAFAISLESGRRVAFPVPLERAGLGPGVVAQLGRDPAFYRLAEEGVEELGPPPRLPARPVAVPTSDGRRIAVLLPRRVSAFLPTDRALRLVEARPAGWQPPALAGALLAWVEDAGDGDEDVWAIDLSEPRPRPRPLAAGPGPQRHVVSDGRHLAWVEADGAIVVMDAATGARRKLDARTGFQAPPTLWNGTACWEERASGDAGIDVRCEDGLVAAGPGDQEWPSRWGPWLLYRQDGRVLLRTAAAE